jgi:hypothetical protein
VPLDSAKEAGDSRVAFPLIAEDEEVPDEDDSAPVAAGPKCTVTFVLVDDAGTIRLDANGGFGLQHLRGAERVYEHCVIYHGRGSSTFEPGETWTITKISLEGRLAEVEGDAARDLDPTNLAIELKVRWRPPTIVSVVDVASHLDLQHVELRWTNDPDALNLQVPPSNAWTFLAEEDSPIELRPGPHDDWRNAGVLWATCPGHDWKRFEVDLRTGGSVKVILDTASDLQVEVSGLDPSRANVLRVRSLKEKVSVLVEVPLKRDGLQRFDPLPTGKYRASIEVGDSWSKPSVFASVDFQVADGAPARVSLHVADMPPIVRAPLSGTITIPAEWHERQPQLSASLITPTVVGKERHTDVNVRPLDDEGRSWRWNMGPVEVGKYVIELYEPKFLVTVDLDAHGRSDVKIDVPPPVELVLHVVDDSTGIQSSLYDLSWHIPRPDGLLNGGYESESMNVYTGVFTFSVPKGPIVLEGHGNDYDLAPIQIDVFEPKSELTVRAKRVTAVILDLMEGDHVAEIPYGDLWDTEVHALGHQGTGSAAHFPRLGYHIRFTEAGKYLVTLLPLSDFEPVPAFEVDAVKGEITHQHVELVHKH